MSFILPSPYSYGAGGVLLFSSEQLSAAYLAGLADGKLSAQLAQATDGSPNIQFMDEDDVNVEDSDKTIIAKGVWLEP